MAGKGASEHFTAGDVDRAPGHAQYDPADVISVFMTAHECAKERISQDPAAQPS